MLAFLFHASLVSLCMFFSLLSLHRSAVFLLSHTQLSSKIVGCLLSLHSLSPTTPFQLVFFLFYCFCTLCYYTIIISSAQHDHADTHYSLTVHTDIKDSHTQVCTYNNITHISDHTTPSTTQIYVFALLWKLSPHAFLHPMEVCFFSFTHSAQH